MCPEQVYTPLDALSTGSMAGWYAFRGGRLVWRPHSRLWEEAPPTRGWTGLPRYVLM